MFSRAPTVRVRMRHRVWCFTINNPTANDIPEGWNAERDVAWCRWQLEQGEAGTPHLQGVVKFKLQATLAQVRALGPGPPGHWEVTRQVKASIDYCSKADGRLEGPWSIGELPHQGKRTDLLAAKEAVDGGMTVMDLAREGHFAVWVKHHVAFQKYANAVATPRTKLTKVTYIYGVPGTGKSAYCRRRYGPGSARAKKTYWKNLETWEGYSGERYVVLNDFYGQHMPFAELLNVLDGNPYMVKRRYDSSVNFVARRVIITSNRPPWDLYSNVANRSALRRRMTDNGCRIYEAKLGEERDIYGPIPILTRAVWLTTPAVLFREPLRRRRVAGGDEGPPRQRARAVLPEIALPFDDW